VIIPAFLHFHHVVPNVISPINRLFGYLYNVLKGVVSEPRVAAVKIVEMLAGPRRNGEATIISTEIIYADADAPKEAGRPRAIMAIYTCSIPQASTPMEQATACENLFVLTLAANKSFRKGVREEIFFSIHLYRYPLFLNDLTPRIKEVIKTVTAINPTEAFLNLLVCRKI